MHYGFGYSQKAKNNDKEIIITKHISKEEYDKHNKDMEFCRYYSHLKEIYSLVNDNANKYLQYMELVSNITKTEKMNDQHIGLEGNRLLINYLTSMGMFIDYGEKEIGKALGKNAREEFQKKTNELYNKYISYRFIVLMRNYAVHFSFPLQTYIRSLVNPSGLFANKSTLLKFKKWKHAKADIEKMPENIKVETHVIQMQECIAELFNHCLFVFSSKLISVIEYANGLVKSVNKKRPVFIEFESEEHFKAGEFTLHFVDFGVVLSALKDLRSHPWIMIKDKTSEELETRLEFYYNNNFIMEGSISDFKEIITNSSDPKDKDPRLALGDRFTLDGFPKEEVSTLVRVINITILSKQLNGKPDRIQYYIEPYSNETGLVE